MISFQQKIAQYRRWPLEVIRITNTAAGVQKTKGKEEESLTSYHGVAYVDLAPLLYPGVSKVHGAYLVQPYSECEMAEKSNHKAIFNEESIKNLVGAQRSSSALGPGKGGAAKGNKTDTKAKVNASLYI